jgi:hypothetical protein
VGHGSKSLDNPAPVCHCGICDKYFAYHLGLCRVVENFILKQNRIKYKMSSIGTGVSNKEVSYLCVFIFVRNHLDGISELRTFEVMY